MNSELHALLKKHGFVGVRRMVATAETQVREAVGILYDDPKMVKGALYEWDLSVKGDAEPVIKKSKGRKAVLRSSISKIIKGAGTTLTASEIAEKLRSRKFEYDPGERAPRDLVRSVQACLERSACFGSSGHGCGYGLTR